MLHTAPLYFLQTGPSKSDYRLVSPILLVIDGQELTVATVGYSLRRM